MAQVEWIKIRVDTFEDEKIRLIEALPEGDTLLVIWLKMLAQAGKINDRGYIYLKEGTPYTPQMLSIVYNRPQPVIDLALKTFQDFGMIEIDERGIRIVNWEKHQNVDGLERIRKQTRERVRKYREKQKQEHQLLPEPAEGNVTCSVTVTDGNAPDKEKEKDIKDKDQPKKGRSSEYTELFEEFWSIYPRKVGKKRAFELWKTRIKMKKATAEQLILAATNYARYCEVKGTEKDYIKHPSTFLSAKEDYLDWLEPIEEEKPISSNRGNVRPFPKRPYEPARGNVIDDSGDKLARELEMLAAARCKKQQAEAN